MDTFNKLFAQFIKAYTKRTEIIADASDTKVDELNGLFKHSTKAYETHLALSEAQSSANEIVAAIDEIMGEE